MARVQRTKEHNHLATAKISSIASDGFCIKRKIAYKFDKNNPQKLHSAIAGVVKGLYLSS
jgi:hypothetical protein